MNRRKTVGLTLAALCVPVSLLTGAATMPTSARGTPADQGRVSPSDPRSPATPVPIMWLDAVPAEPAKGSAADDRDALPIVRELAADDPRRADAERLVDNEPARFVRTLVTRAWARFGLPSTWHEPRLPVLLQEGGNFARHGFRLQTGSHIEEHPDVPYVILELDSSSLSDTLLHEGGHVLHSIATGGRRPTTWWSPLPHTTFAVTDPLTAVSEGFGIHLETLYGHYGSDEARRAFYHRLAPAFGARGTRRAEFFAPIADLMTFSQSWARYQGVRDGWAVFAGNPWPGNYLRSQFDPSRDRATLKPANAMVASEGVVATVLFWIGASMAESRGARPGQGLVQAGLVEAEEMLLAALGAATREASGDFRPDLIDVIASVGDPRSAERQAAVVRFVETTRGVTARPGIRDRWRAFYEAAIVLDLERSGQLFDALEQARTSLLDGAIADPSVLRGNLGPVIPVRAPKVALELKALGESFPLEFDLNAATEAEWAALPGVDGPTAARVLAERDRRPFASLAEFEHRLGVSAAALGLEAVTRER